MDLRSGEPPTPHEPLYNLTDLGNAERLTAEHGPRIRYVRAWRRWYLWDGRIWAPDETGEVDRMAQATVRQIFRRAASEDSATERERLAKHALKSEQEARLRAMVSLASSDAGVALRAAMLDADPWLLTVANGTLDLRTGELGPHNSEHLITRASPVAYLPDVACPRWQRFLREVMWDREDLVQYLQRAVGYSLTGDTREQCLFLLHGTGANGKSTFLNVLRAVMGAHALQADFDTFLERRNRDGPRNDLAGLAGARAVLSSEAAEGRRLDETAIKAMTGEDVIRARFLYSEPFEFFPRFKIWLSANHKPVIRGTDDAIWRRLHLVPFEVSFLNGRRDDQLMATLTGELPGILAWAVEGCQMWLENGLRPPDDVRAATQAYRTESDVLGAYLDERCVIKQGAAVSSAELYRDYRQWTEEGGEREMSQTMFGRKLSERGILAAKNGAGSKVRIGIKLLHPAGLVPQPTIRTIRNGPFTDS